MLKPKKVKRPAKIKAPRAITSTQSLKAFVKSICDIMRSSNCAGALQYVQELTWILFLRILDAQEERDRETAKVLGKPYLPALREPYRWQDWAAPYDEKAEAFTPEGKRVGWKREELKTKIGNYFTFINQELLPYLHKLDMTAAGLPNLATSPKQRVIARIMTAVERVRVDSETDFGNILDLIHQISIGHIDDTHFFILSQFF
jgi:type I restriction enzyme M protein